jgi:hypothetical protein
MSEYEVRKKIVAAIEEKFKPLRVYTLPGIDVQDQETATGLNVLVVLEKSLSRAQTRSFRPGVDVPAGFMVDIQFMTLEEFEKSSVSPGRLAYLAANKGTLVYEKESEGSKESKESKESEEVKWQG